VLDCISLLTNLVSVFLDLDLDKKDDSWDDLAEVKENEKKRKTLKGTLYIEPPGPVTTNTTLYARYSENKSVNYEWSRNGIKLFDTNVIGYTPKEAGNYSVRVYDEGWFSISELISAAVTVNDSELSGTLSISTPLHLRDSPVPAGEQLTALYSGYEDPNYQWRKSGSNNVVSINRTYTPDEPGNYTLTAQKTGYKSKTVSITINYRDLKGIIEIDPPGPVPVGTPLTARYYEGYAGSEEDVNYFWHFYAGQGKLVTVSNTNRFTPTEAGSYYVKIQKKGYREKGGASVSVVAVPGVPANVRVTSESSTEISIMWDAVSGADGYYLYQVYQGTYTRIGGAIYTPGANLQNLDPDSSYTISVSAFNNISGEGDKSPPLKVMTTWY